jgi:RHS repeat-associated protein
VLDIKANTQPASGANRSTYNYTVNAVGQRTDVTVTGYSGGNWIWDYDALGQVKKADSPNSTFDRAYLYDDIGNRKNAADGLTVIAPGTQPTYTANSLNQYTLINAAVPSYDFAGNMTGDAGANSAAIARTYVWDGENRLKEVKITAAPQTQIAAYRYDAFHRRISKTLGTSTTWFIYDGWNLIGEYTATTGSLPVLKKTHHWGLDLSGSIQGAGGVGGLLGTDLYDSAVGLGRYFPTYDGNGNVSEYLRSGGVSARFTYDAFGRPLTTTTTVPTAHLSFRFSTKYRDPETDFYYYGYRYYSAVLGRWLGRDPIGEKGGTNLNCVVKNDTVNNGDYLGLVPWPEGGPVTGEGDEWFYGDHKIDEKHGGGNYSAKGMLGKLSNCLGAACDIDEIISPNAHNILAPVDPKPIASLAISRGCTPMEAGPCQKDQREVLIIIDRENQKKAPDPPFHSFHALGRASGSATWNTQLGIRGTMDGIKDPAKHTESFYPNLKGGELQRYCCVCK